MLLNLTEMFNTESGVIIVLTVLLFEVILLAALFIYIMEKRRRWDKLNDYLGDVAKTVNSVRYGDLSKKIDNIDFPDSEYGISPFGKFYDHDLRFRRRLR